MIDLWKIKENFSTLVVETEPWTLAQFVMWLDLKISEYKIKGFMVLDHQNSTKPRWMSPDEDTDPGTDTAPQPPPCRKCNKGDNPSWEPYRMSHQPPTNYNHSKDHSQRSSGTYGSKRNQGHISNRGTYSDINFNSDIHNPRNTAVIDLENLPEPSVYISDDITEQTSSQRGNDTPSSGKMFKRNTASSAVSYSASSNNKNPHVPSRHSGSGSNSSFTNPFSEKKQETSNNTISSLSNSSNVQDSTQNSLYPEQGANQNSVIDIGAKKGPAGQEDDEGQYSEGIIPMYLHTNISNSDNQQFNQREATPTFILSEVKQEDVDSSIADISGFDEEMQPIGNDNSRTSYSDDEQGGNLDQNIPLDGSSSRPGRNRHSVMSYAASVIELPTFEDPLVRRVLEDSTSTPSRHMWSKIISRCAYHMLSKGVPHKHDYQAFSEAFYHRYPCVGTSRGPHPWTNLAKQVSQKVRKIRWNFKRKTQEDVFQIHSSMFEADAPSQEDY